MDTVPQARRPAGRLFASPALALAFGALTLAGCASSPSSAPAASAAAPAAASAATKDPRVGLKAGMFDAEQAAWNVRLLSSTPAPGKFAGSTNSDLAFTGKYAIQGNYNGYMVWDVSNPAAPALTVDYYCPASQSDVSVYKNLLFVSGEGNSGRLDCGDQGVKDPVSHDRLRGIRIFDITDIAAPKYIGNVQTCRGSHTHTVLADPKDKANIYIYVSGSAGVRSEDELPGCSRMTPDKDPNSALFRIEVIKVPLANPKAAAIVSSPRIFNDLVAPPGHGEAPEDIAASKKAAEAWRAKGGYTAEIFGMERPIPSQFINPMLDSIVQARGGSGAPTAADSATLRTALPAILAARFGGNDTHDGAVRPGPTQCHDITVYPAIGRAGGACEGYGLLLDITDPVNPKRIAAVSDSNFSYWHSATFNNSGTKLLFSDEWGGGGSPKCRATDKKEWGADAIFTLSNDTPTFRSYYKLPAAQTSNENCVAHNGSLIPVPGRDIMVQAWYQGGISVFDWTDAAHPKEIAFHDRGPVDSTRMGSGGSWSVYWYNGHMISSEIGRGLDIFELLPSAYLSQNEIDAAKLVWLEYFNAQGQPQFVWPAKPVVAQAYLDQLARSNGLAADKISSARKELDKAAKESGSKRQDTLNKLATRLDSDAAGAADAAKVRTLATTVRSIGASE
ncbi:MAG TPA: hypothetical protein VFV65_03700 [Gemmatimonadales bacterium]|nr:hypothetical protein [Gemmatimonadales bacterium]